MNGQNTKEALACQPLSNYSKWYLSRTIKVTERIKCQMCNLCDKNRHYLLCELQSRDDY